MTKATGVAATAGLFNRPIHEVFSDQAARRPGAVAVVCGDVVWSYAELNERAERIAAMLGRNTTRAPIGVFLRRGPDMIAAILGILKAGTGYLPLDPGQPAEWLAHQTSVTGVDTVIAEAWPTSGAGLRVVPPDLPPAVSAAGAGAGQDRSDPDDDPSRMLAYVLHTSGSTGRPKAVAVPHRAVVRLILQQDYLDTGPDLTTLLHSPMTFDASTLELWAPLLTGGRVVVAPPGPLSLGTLARLIRSHGVSMLWLTAALFHLVIDENPSLLRPLRQLFTGGEVISPGHLERARTALPECTITAGYGPTESTVFATTYRVPADRPVQVPVPIGWPIAGTTVHILDADLRPVDGSQVGDLYIGGDGLAWGYLHAPATTARQFIPHPAPSSPGDRLYQTGDRARWREDGLIEFVGRLDDQVKIRGHRIELGEVESALLAHDSVASAMATAREDPIRGRQLIAHVAFRSPQEGQEQQLRRHMQRHAPDHLRPDVYVVGPPPALTANGKLDRSGIRAPDPESSRGTRSYQVVVNACGQHAVWAENVAIPAGWRSVGVTGMLETCLERIESLWPDIRPGRPVALRRSPASSPGP